MSVTTAQDPAAGVTFVHLSSESGDHYYLTIPGQADDAQVTRHVEQQFSGTDDEGCVYVEHIERWTPPTST